MRSLPSCCLLAAILLCAASPEASAQTPPKYWLVFTDQAPVSDAGPARVVSPRARERRTLRGSVDGGWLDQPVSNVYLDRLRAVGIVPIVTSRWLNAVSAHLSPAQLERARQLDFVKEVRSVARAVRPPRPHPSHAPRDTARKSALVDFGPSRAQIEAINTDELLESGIDGSGVLLGFLDTPFGGFEHDAFSELRLERRLLNVKDFVGMPQAQYTHGMSVASVAAGFAPGHLVGPAHGAEILAATTEYVPSETNQEEDFFVAGLEWLEEQGADVVNVSLGYTTFDSGERSYTPEDLDGDTGITTQAADHAASLGVVMVVSAGNSGCSSPEHCWYYVGMPADGHAVIAVGAVDPDSTRSDFSSFGPTADGRRKPDVSAPGTSVYAAVPGGYTSYNGTSFASPLVAGVVCQMLQVNPDLNPEDVRRILRETASQADNPDNSLGWGIVNAREAVRAAVAVSVEQPPAHPLSAHAYPNPATDFVFIDINAGNPSDADVSVYDVVGRRIFRSDQATPAADGLAVRIPTQSFVPGVYLYRVHQRGETVAGTFVVLR